MLLIQLNKFDSIEGLLDQMCAVQLRFFKTSLFLEKLHPFHLLQLKFKAILIEMVSQKVDI